MIELFTTNKYDEKIVIIDSSEFYTVRGLKYIVSEKIKTIQNLKNNIALIDGNDFETITNFFACVFCEKNIYLTSDKTKLKDLDCEILTRDNFEKDINDNDINDFVFPKIDLNTTNINFFTLLSGNCVKKSLFNLISEANDIFSELNFAYKNNKIFSTISICNLFGFIYRFLIPICNKQVVYIDKIKDYEFADLQDSLLITTPAFLNSTVKNKIPINAKYIISSGSEILPKIYKKIAKNSKLIDVYMTAETGTIAYRKSASEDFKPFKNVEIKKEKDKIFVVSNYSYEKISKLKDEADFDGKKIILNNNKNRKLTINGKKIPVQELENDINKSIFVETSYCFNFNNKIAILCALTKKGKNFLLKSGLSELKKELKNNINSRFIPQEWCFTDEVPINETGKIDLKFINFFFSAKCSLPIILNRTIKENIITFELFFHQECKFFNGYNFKNPFVPEFLQLFLAGKLAEFSFKYDLSAGQTRGIKFNNLITPNSTILLDLILLDKSIIYRYFTAEKIYSSGVFSCENVFRNMVIENK